MFSNVMKKIKSYFVPDTPTVSESSNTSVKKKNTTVPMVKESKKKPVDSVEVKNKSRDNIYASLGEFFNEYSINIEEAKKFGLLENIAGVDDISKISSAELAKVKEALKDALGITGHWILPWQKRDIDDLKTISKDANKRLINSKTGGNQFGQLWHNFTSSKLDMDELRADAEKIKQLPMEERQEACDKLLKKYGYYLNNASVEEKKKLVNFISNLSSEQRVTATEVSIISCGKNRTARSEVAAEIENDRHNIVTKRDVFGNIPNKDNSTKIATLTFGNMNEEHTLNALNNMDKRTQKINAELSELNSKKNNGTLTEAEQNRLNELIALKENYSVSGYSGALIAIPNNSSLTCNAQENLAGRAFDDAKRNNIANEVCAQVCNYIEKHPEATNGNNTKFIKTLDKITENEFSETLETGHNHKNYNTSDKTKANLSETNNETYNNKTCNNNETEKENVKYNNIEKNELVSNNKKQSDQTHLKAENKYITNNIKNKNNPFSMTLNSETKFNQTSESNKKAVTKDIVNIINKEGVEGLNKTLKTRGADSTIREVYSNIANINDNAVILKAEKIYKTFDPSRQADILKNISNSGLSELLKITPSETLELLNGETFANYWATKQVENAVQEIEEKKQNTKDNLLV